MSQKRNKDLIIIGIIWIIVSIPILIMLCPEVGEMIQAEAIITLVFVTIFYAKQTKDLVRQEQLSLKEEKKKIAAGFWEGRLKEFYLPLNFIILKLQAAIKVKPIPFDEITKITEEVIKLLNKGYLITVEFSKSQAPFLKQFTDFSKSLLIFIVKGSVPEESWINETFEKSEDLRKIIEKEKKIIEYKINEVYGFSIDEELKRYIEWLETEYFNKGL